MGSEGMYLFTGHRLSICTASITHNMLHQLEINPRFCRLRLL